MVAGRQVRKIRIHGRFDEAAFVGFVRERARLLSIEAAGIVPSPHCIETRIAGDEVLLGMFELACLLGPIEGVVTRLEVVE